MFNPQPKPEKESNKSKKVYRIPNRSKKRAKAEREYSRKRKEFLDKNPLCEHCGKMATEVHHKRGRIGDLLTDERHFMAVCREDHQQIEMNPDWAHQMRYSESRLKNN